MGARRMVGVLGGMGPLATVDFMQKVILSTPASRDQDHIPMVVYSVPQIPDRVSAIAAGTDEPFPAILAGLRTLEKAGAGLIVMPCNTAHAWYDRLAASTDIDIVHMADAVRRKIGDREETIALMATAATVRAGFYQRYLADGRRRVIVPAEPVQDLLNKAIRAVKAAEEAEALAFMQEAGEAMLAAGADRMLLACTELPLAARGTSFEDRCLDATQCLAEVCIALSMQGPNEHGALMRGAH
ncbi:MAG: aspartate/glutamate racemase family protein [Rhizobiales bacterium]|nr:aspartate/glutamate racemase family protein [Hyphomicrobiales bacterium]